MPESEGRSQEYPNLLEDGQEEGRFLRSRRWLLDAGVQDSIGLLRGLRGEAARLAEMEGRPVFSLLAVLRDPHPQHLRELILSCRCQSYQDWELILVDDGSRDRGHMEMVEEWAARDPRVRPIAREIPGGDSHARNVAAAAATGDFLSVVDADGILHPMALGILARHLREDPAVNLVFTNELELERDSDRPVAHLLKPPFDAFTLLRIPYLGRLVAMRRDLVLQVADGGPIFRQELDGIEEHDLWLRLALSGRVVARHVPLYAYSRREGSAEAAAARHAALPEKRAALLHRHVPRAYPGATWTSRPADGPSPLVASSVWITGLPGRPRPGLLIVVPFKDQADTTLACLDAIERQVHSLDIRVVLVDNNSAEPETGTKLAAWLGRPRGGRYEVLEDRGAFNFARLNNAAVARFGGDRDLILFLNNDVELSTPQALQVMAMQLLACPDAGFVGIKLNYPGGRGVQHGGVRFVEHMLGSGYPQLVHANSPQEFVDADRVALCVTFACAMTRRETFESLGGLEERFVPNGFGDVDISLRALAAGYRHYYLGSLEGVHHESLSRGSSNEDVEFSTLHERHGRVIAEWRMRHLFRAARHPWPVASPLQGAGVEAVHPAGMPLRYRIADRAANALRRLLGPGYGPCRTAAVRAVKLARRFRSLAAIFSALRAAIKPIPLLGPAAAWGIRSGRRAIRSARIAKAVAGHVLREPRAVKRLGGALSAGGVEGLLRELAEQLPELPLQPYAAALQFRKSRPTPERLASLRSRDWPADAPKFSVIVPVYNTREAWLREMLGSVLGQTYPHWELICVDDASPSPRVREVLEEFAASDPRIVPILERRNRGVAAATNRGLEAASGDYVAFLDHDDSLEPHALQAFAEAVLRDRPDMLYSDEAVTGERLDKVLRVDLRPDFSYDHYLGHPYFVHLIAARTSIVRGVGGLDEGLAISQDVDLNLRLIEACETVCHVPEVLYRWRTHVGSLGHRKMDECTEVTRGVLERHFRRTGQRAEFEDRIHFNHRDVRFLPPQGLRVAVLVTPSGIPGRTEECLAGLGRSLDRALADVVVLDPRDGVGLARRLNEAVGGLEGAYTHLLFLDDAIRAGDRGWLEHMLGFASRRDVGVVGALMLNDRRRVVHSGLAIRRDGRIVASHRGSPFRHWIAGRNPGRIGELLASHDVSAVAGACLLTGVGVFEGLGGFDEGYNAGRHDADYCLRAAESGYKVVLDAYAVHRLADARAEDAILRGSPDDDARFRERHGGRIERGDPFDRAADEGSARPPRTTRIDLPSSPKGARPARVELHGPDESKRRPHDPPAGASRRGASDLDRERYPWGMKAGNPE
ncbi:Putative glycosyltransferase EpsH [Aquisphaera giovannonii]|uniref:Glycosyltransferase EpsH n=1 Tax=Aquisphaera giovannonii TaxID=406548 RepID=A0A5B9VWI6_9BACT|nr:glycosyltransferase [Aquisphaera giovannonii]QEH32816.1 Putative glycosyltransferase EpsH [Aquisphaera giovannonii]